MPWRSATTGPEPERSAWLSASSIDRRSAHYALSAITTFW
jgi:hypothetical protein